MKKFLASALALAMALSLTACGGGQSGGSQSSGGQNNSGQSSGGGSGAVTVKVGGIGPITGDQAQYGTATAWGAEIAVEEINALNGPIRLDYDFQDDTGVADTAVAAYNQLKDWAKDAPLVIYGCTTTAPCVAVASETFADRYFQLTPSASSPEDRKSVV